MHFFDIHTHCDKYVSLIHLQNMQSVVPQKNFHFSVLWFLVALNFFCIGVLLTKLTCTLSQAAITRLTFGLSLAALNLFAPFARISAQLLLELSISSLQTVHQFLLQKKKVNLKTHDTDRHTDHAVGYMEV